VGPAAAAELEALDRYHLDAGAAQQGVRLDVPFVGDHDAGRERKDVVAVVRLLTFALVTIAAGLEEPHRL